MVASSKESRTNDRKIIQILQGFLAVEAVAYAMMAIVHLLEPSGERDLWAAIPELIIAAALTVGFTLSWTRPRTALKSIIAAQTFALLFTLLGMFIVIMTLTPETVPNLIFHASVAVIFVVGLAIAPPAAKRRSTSTQTTVCLGLGEGRGTGQRQRARGPAPLPSEGVGLAPGSDSGAGKRPPSG